MKKHIMVIDADKEELSSFMDALKDLPYDDGFKCTYASTGNHALEMLKYLIPDYIFIREEVPSMSCAEMLGAVRRIDQLKKTQVFIYSPSPDDRLLRMAERSGADGCLRKADDLHGFVASLAEILSPSSPPAYVFSNM